MIKHILGQNKFIFFSLIFASIFIAVCLSYLFYQFDEATLRHYINSFLPQGLAGALTLIVILSIATSIGLPRQVAAFTAGFSFGIGWGVLLATIAAIIGCFITVKCAQLFFHARLHTLMKKKYKSRFAKVTDFFAVQTFSKAFVIRILPAGSNFITNIIAGMVKVPIKPYILGSGLGFIPQMFIFSLAGSGVRLGDKDQLFISIGLFITAFILGALIYHRSKLAK